MATASVVKILKREVMMKKAVELYSNVDKDLTFYMCEIEYLKRGIQYVLFAETGRRRYDKGHDNP